MFRPGERDLGTVVHPDRCSTIRYVSKISYYIAITVDAGFQPNLAWFNMLQRLIAVSAALCFDIVLSSTYKGGSVDNLQGR